MKRLLSTILAVVFLCSMFAGTVLAAPAPGGVAPMAAVSRDSDGLVYHGLQADYYIMNGSYVFTEHKGTYVDSNIAFANMETNLRDRTGQNDYAGAIWSGWIVPPETANYTFYAYTDNGHRLYVNDNETPILNW